MSHRTAWAWLAGLALVAGGGDSRAADAKPRKVVLIAGPLDAGHPRGTHEYEKSVKLIKHCLDHSPDAKGVRCEAHLGGWPEDPRTLDDADAIVLVASGSDRREADHPLLVGDRLATIDKQMKRGCGLALIHWCTFVPKQKAGDKVLEWVGGYFDYESGPAKNGWYSKIQTATTKAVPGSRDHPIARGVGPFEVKEEWYYNIRFRERDPRLVPVLVTPVPKEAGEQTVGWAVERTDGGRGFGFTGGHFFDNWKVPEFRRLLLNAVLWIAKADVPEKGVRSEMPTDADLAKVEASLPAVGITLVEGRFGKALDARLGPALADGDDRFRRPPLTVECWAKLFSDTSFNALVASDTKSSANHWEVFTQVGTGRFAAYLPGYEPANVFSETAVCDGKWHYLAMTFDGKVVRLFVDGKAVKEQVMTRRDVLKPEPGPLMVGQAVGPGHKVPCDGLIDDVRISKVVRTIGKVPEGELPRDADTVGLWRFDRDEGLVGDAAWTPPPVYGKAEPWEKETDKDWVDARFRKTDTGPFLNATFDYSAWKGKVRSYKGTAIRVGDNGKAAVLFDRNRLRLAAGWSGGYLLHSDRRFALLNTPTPNGPMSFTTAAGPGWAEPRKAWDDRHPPTAPLPREWAKYRGLYLHGQRVVLSYTVGDTPVLESPWAEPGDGPPDFSRHLEVGPARVPLRLRACDFPEAGELSRIGGVPVVVAKRLGVWTAVALVGDERRTTLLPGDRGRVEVTVQPGEGATRFRLVYWTGQADDLTGFVKRVKGGPQPADLAAWTKTSSPRWGDPIVTRGEVGTAQGPFAVDTLTVPYENPYHALMFLTGLDFLPDGSLAVCSAHGDVWLVRGLDDKLGRVTWKRFATGLYQPMGLKVVDGKVHVIERGQLTRLHDANGDGEADFYENVNNDWHTAGGEHSYDTCLDTDPAGNFYFFKTGDTDTPTGGCLMRVAKDGLKAEVYATGFRHPIGLSVSPRGQVTGADQEGNWMPATRVDFYKQGGFYGDMRGHHRVKPPATYDGPFCWLPREADNSAGGQVWVPPDAFGPLAGKTLHLSYGRCRMLLLLRQTLGDVEQGGAVNLGVEFLSGAKTGRFGPDGHLYVVGLRGWQTGAKQDGCLQRVRYTGRPLRVPTDLSVHADGIKLTFAEPLDRQAAAEPSRWRLERWNYRYSGDYGSKHWSAAEPNREGHDFLKVESVTVSEDGRTAFLRADGLAPVMQMKLGFDVKAADGEPCSGSVWHTVHRLAERGGALIR